ncbi:DUF1616 domain-containing protein [Haloarcula rubripromontorii]|uniref:DUF1616 domain-containing protein n=1 Tax=Haloarcula rubripromontorii TaxID=1705562 RepID=A0A0N0BNY2_9EURY|nr:DUF1616 domain-containing protein [Haloarcula rubripromontorii]KOX93154.1 hypothetical protein AMS69_11970 [Haloarcula rubripromontorii]NLV06492.1 DUF1616 domain-containing protein [Haloarcula rubripromontorii]
MADTPAWKLLLPRQLRHLPADLAGVIGVVILTNLAALLPVVSDTPIRIVAGLGFTLFIPGYAFIAALFPEAGSGPTAGGENDTDPRADGIDGIERTALSFGLSIALVPLVGLVLNFTPWGIRLLPILISLSGLTLVLTAIAAVRRWALPADERFRVPYRAWLRAGRDELFSPASRTDAVLNVLLVFSILLAAASVGYAITVPKDGERFSEFYLLTEEEDGELVADGYPTEFRQGEGRSLVVGIGNQEHERTAYTIIAELQRVERVGNETQVRERSELRRFQPTLGHNETWQRQHEVTPMMTGDRLRLQYLLYRGSPPETVGQSTAYREVHLWVNVTG